MILRPYQETAVAEALRLLRAGRRPIVAVPTGGGKTVIGAAVVERLNVPTRWTAHRRELIAQARAKLPATCGVFSVQERTTRRAELLVVDECHHATAASYRRHLDAHTGPVLGLTATPYRLDGRGLGEVFTDIIAPVSVADLVASGVLVAPKTYSAKNTVDTRKLKTVAGDYSTADAAAVMDKPSVIGDAVTEYRERCPRARAVAFCVTVEHAAHVAAAFNAAGVPAAVVSGDMPAAERDATLANLASGAVRLVANCMVLTEGWDLPALDAAIILRPTQSRCLHLQMIGRVMRSHPGKTAAVVLDHAGNTLRLGKVTTPVPFTLDGAPPRASSATGLVTCRSCYAIVDATNSDCPECGTPLRETERQDVLVVGGIGGTERLVEVDDAPASFAEMAAAWDEFETARVLGSRPPGWSIAQFKNRFNEWPIVSPSRVLLDPNTDEAKRQFYADACRIMAAKGRPTTAAAGMFKGRFGTWPPKAWGVRYA